jgi:hypothetical protein
MSPQAARHGAGTPWRAWRYTAMLVLRSVLVILTGAKGSRKMVKSDRIVTVNIGPMQGRTTMLKHYLENLQSVLTTRSIEAREHFDENQEEFVLSLLQLSQSQWDAAQKELHALDEILVAATQREEV